MHMIRQEAAFELQTSVGEHGYITELDIDRYLIANHEPKRGEEARTEAARQKAQATMDMIRASYASKGFTPEPLRPRTRPIPLPTPQKQD